jgi:hypothetical protein
MNNATVRQCKVCGQVKPLASVRRSRSGGHICLRCAAHRRRNPDVIGEANPSPEPATAANAAPAPDAEAAQLAKPANTANAAQVAETPGVQHRRTPRRRRRTRTAKGRYAGHWGAAVRDLGALILVLLAFFGLWVWVTSRL